MNGRTVNALHRLLASCELILDTMSRTDQPAMYARLKSDVAALKAELANEA